MKSRFPAVLIAALALLAAACGPAKVEYIRPWFRVVTSPEYVVAPHAISWGGARRAQVLVDDDWHELPHGTRERGDFNIHPLGDAVALDELPVTIVGDPNHERRIEGPMRVFTYHRGYLAPIELPK